MFISDCDFEFELGYIYSKSEQYGLRSFEGIKDCQLFNINMRIF